MPAMPLVARSVRRFLTDVISTLSADYGVRQFLEIGTGLPTADNTHEVAQQVALTSRIVYVDNDPAVLSHARALLTSALEVQDRLRRGGPAGPGRDPFRR
jgi:hypothetical protein